MNKTERQLAITLELQRSKTLRAEDLASQFETSVRTIYRDIQALSEAGVPILGAPGQGYSLMEGYFLPPVRFTAEEAVSLLMGADFIEQRLDTDYGINAKSAKRKIEATLAESVRNESRLVRETMRLLHIAEQSTEERVKTYLNQVRDDKIIEAVNFYIASIEERNEDVIFQFRVRYPEELLHHLLGWGGDIEVIEPKSLRFKIREVAKKILEHY